MCGRFTLRTPMGLLIEHFGIGECPELQLRFNIAPSQAVAVVRTSALDRSRQLALLKWGLVPSWAKDASGGARMINARSETVFEKPAFRGLIRRRRCLVLADGYFEWKKIGTRKQPFYLRRQDNGPLAFAGLWDAWSGGGGDERPLETCAIITTPANEISAPIHDRMPAILHPEAYSLWLDPDVDDAGRIRPLLRPFESSLMVSEPVSTFVNHVRNDAPQCIEAERELF